METWHAERALLDSIQRDVAIDVSDGTIAAVRVGVPASSDDRRLPGVVVPGFVNAHSHAFHRALRGRSQVGAGDFWAWRETMYSVADRLTPDNYLALATATFAEMALAGITHVYEFHYVHHDRGGAVYSEPNAMTSALIEAAHRAGIRITVLDVCYLQAGVRGGELSPVQARFADRDVETWADRVRAFSDRSSIGTAIHSVRAVGREAMATVAAVARELDVDLHVHVSEQRRENEECMDVFQMTPTELLADAGALGPRTTAVHATHVTPMDVELLATTRTRVCMCPTTERDLADGVGPTSVFHQAGIPLGFGTDSHAVIDMFEEARCAELHERLVTNRRGLTPPGALLAATAGGNAIAPGMPADLVAVDVRSPRLAGDADGGALVFAAAAADVTDVVVAGEPVVVDRVHSRIEDVGVELERAMALPT